MFVYVLTTWCDHEDAGLIMNESIFFATYMDAYRCAEDFIITNRITDVYSITKAPIFGTAGMDNENEELLSYYINKQWYHGDDVRKVTYDGSEKTIYLETDTFGLWDMLEPSIHKDSPIHKVWKYISNHNNEVVEELQGYKEFCDYTLSKYTSEMIDMYKNLLNVNMYNYENRTYIRGMISQLHNNWKMLVVNKNM